MGILFNQLIKIYVIISLCVRQINFKTLNMKGINNVTSYGCRIEIWR